MTAAATPTVTVEENGKVVRGLAVPFNQPTYVLNSNGDVIAEMFDSESIAELPGQVPLLVGHRRDLAPVGVVRSSAFTRYGLGIEAELIGSDHELEGWRRKLAAGLGAGLSIGFTESKRARWERPQRPGEPPLKRPRGARVVEVSLVHWPAYATAGVTSLSQRSAEDQRLHEESDRIILEHNLPYLIEYGRILRRIGGPLSEQRPGR